MCVASSSLNRVTSHGRYWNGSGTSRALTVMNESSASGGALWPKLFYRPVWSMKPVPCQQIAQARLPCVRQYAVPPLAASTKQGLTSIRKHEDPNKDHKEVVLGPPRVGGGEHPQCTEGPKKSACIKRSSLYGQQAVRPRKPLGTSSKSIQKKTSQEHKNLRFEGRHTPNMEKPLTIKLRAGYWRSTCGQQPARP